MNENLRIIKKYTNRTMYDTSQSKYISLPDLKQYVVEGVPFEIRTAKTNKDITRQVFNADNGRLFWVARRPR